MACHCIRALALGVLCTALVPRAEAKAPAVRPGGRQPDDAAKVAAKIDEHIGAGLARARIKPASLTDDATFYRRLSLDLVGRIPPSMHVRRFLNDRSPDKRRAAIDKFLDSPGYANHFSNVWRDLLLPEAISDLNRRFLVPSMERWLFKQFSENRPYDEMVRELVTLPMPTGRDEMNAFRFYQGDGASPMSFYLAKEGKSEDIAAATTRLFLGIRLECAQCHDHPTARWTREQFWSQAAFFGGIRPTRRGNFFFGQLTEVADRRELAIPNTERVAQARFLDGKEPRWQYKVGARTTLAEWMTRRDNPFFAKAIVNRMWAHFFGIGLVDPVDDFGDLNPPSHPELLEELAKQFVAHDYDLKFLIRAITSSKTYQLASAYEGREPPERLFARMPIKGLTGEQFYDSIVQATALRDGIPRRQRFFYFGSPRQEFLDRFVAQERRTESITSIPQALTLMNNLMITNATHPDRSEALAAIVGSTFMTTNGKIEAMFMATLSRKPRTEELARFNRYVEKGGATGDRKKALSDVFWALLNSTEFALNH
jgi:hypothetical protein